MAAPLGNAVAEVTIRTHSRMGPAPTRFSSGYRLGRGRTEGRGLLSSWIGVENFAYSANQRFEAKGLLQQISSWFQNGSLSIVVPGVSRHEQDPHFGMKRPHASSELPPAQLRHDDIGQEEIGSDLMGLANAQRVCPAHSGQHPVATRA